MLYLQLWVTANLNSQNIQAFVDATLNGRIFKANLSEILPVNYKFICDSVSTYFEKNNSNLGT